MDYEVKSIDETLFTFENLCDSIEEIFNNAEKIKDEDATKQLSQYERSLSALVCGKINENLLTYDPETILHIMSRLVTIKKLIS